MLKLTRAEGEKIFIGPDIVVEFCGTNRDGEAVIGIIAPREIKVHREELARQIASEIEVKNQEARRLRKQESKDESENSKKSQS